MGAPYQSGDPMGQSLSPKWERSSHGRGLGTKGGFQRYPRYQEWTPSLILWKLSYLWRGPEQVWSMADLYCGTPGRGFQLPNYGA